MPTVGFEPTIAAGERPQTYALDRAATGTGNIKLNTSICLSFMYVTCKKSTTNLQLIDNRIVSPDTSTLSMASYADWLECGIRKRLDWRSDWLCAISNGMISVESRHTIIRTYKLRVTNKTLPPLPVFLSRNPSNSFTEHSFRNTGIAVKPSETRLGLRRDVGVWHVLLCDTNENLHLR